jgi:hypothetical protein
VSPAACIGGSKGTVWRTVDDEAPFNTTPIRGAISIALPSPAIAFHPPCYRPAIELPSPAIDGSPSPYNPRPMETGLSGLMPSAGCHRDMPQTTSIASTHSLPTAFHRQASSTTESPERSSSAQPASTRRRAET